VVPFAAGAATDIVARTVLEQLSRQLGQPIIVENKPGAGGTIGAAAAAQAAPDGYTLLVHSNSHTVAPATYRKLSYDAEKDLVGVIPLASVPMVMITSPNSGAKTLAELVRAAKAKPGAMNYVSAGTGGATHLGAERLLNSAGFSAVHIPTKGSGEALTEVMSGRADFYFAPVGFALQHTRSGKIVPLAVSSSQRSAAMPEVPTFAELGLSGFEELAYYGLFAPVGTPQAVIDRYSDALAKILAQPEVKDRLTSMGINVVHMPPRQFANHVRSYTQTWEKIVKNSGFQAQ